MLSRFLEIWLYKIYFCSAEVKSNLFSLKYLHACFSRHMILILDVLRERYMHFNLRGER